jgi:formate/nitrite transporter FocA (FNT family)
MKSALQVAVLVLTALMGLWLLGHGIVIGAAVQHRVGESPDILSTLIEASVFIAGGICVVSVAAQQLYCWRTHRKDGGLI